MKKMEKGAFPQKSRHYYGSRSKAKYPLVLWLRSTLAPTSLHFLFTKICTGSQTFQPLDLDETPLETLSRDCSTMFSTRPTYEHLLRERSFCFPADSGGVGWGSNMCIRFFVINSLFNIETVLPDTSITDLHATECGARLALPYYSSKAVQLLTHLGNEHVCVCLDRRCRGSQTRQFYSH